MGYGKKNLWLIIALKKWIQTFSFLLLFYRGKFHKYYFGLSIDHRIMMNDGHRARSIFIISSIWFNLFCLPKNVFVLFLFIHFLMIDSTWKYCNSQEFKHFMIAKYILINSFPKSNLAVISNIKIQQHKKKEYKNSIKY